MNAIVEGRTALGIELGSTRIKACVVDSEAPSEVLAVGSHAWENRFEDGTWTYALDDVWAGVQSAFAALRADVEARHGHPLTQVGAIGVSGMMHGYLAFDAEGELLAPFRTWRNTSTGDAATELSALFTVNIPLRWSIAHLHQAVLNGESHVSEVRSITTLSGYVHRALTGRNVLGVGDASGMFPLDRSGRDYDPELVRRYDKLAAGRLVSSVADLLPTVALAGDKAGELTSEGALLLDPTGALEARARMCAPEGDAGTGMVATNAVAPRTGNVSAGTSIFAMVVLERPLADVHPEVDLVATPAGDPVAMVHCNNGASELAEWARMFSRFSEAAGTSIGEDVAFDALFTEALAGEADAGGVLAYNFLAGEPIAEVDAGRPMVVRTPESRLTLANFMRAQLYGAFGTLALGMLVLEEEGVELDRMFAHGGMFRTEGVAQRFLAAALRSPVSVGATASEGGAWGIAVLAAFSMAAAADPDANLPSYLDTVVFPEADAVTLDPDPADADGFAVYLESYRRGLEAVRAAGAAIT